MTVTKVSDPAQRSQTPGHKNRTLRLKYIEPQEILDEVKISRQNLNRTDFCPVSDYLEGHLSDDILEVEDHLFSDPTIGPELLCENIAYTHLFNDVSTEEGAATVHDVQHDAALKLAEHDWKNIHIFVEGLFLNPYSGIICSDALYVLLSLIYKNHLFPREFLNQTIVKRKLPADLDLG